MQRKLGTRSRWSVWALALLSVGLGRPALAASTHPLRVQNGVLTVDGMAVRTDVTLNIGNLHYLYIGLPGAGTAVIAEKAFPGAQEERGAFKGNTLTVMAGGSRMELTAENRMRGTHPAFVRFDPGRGPAGRVPAVSYGDTAMVPAAWPERGVAAMQTSKRRVKVRGHRALRTAKLCSPSARGREHCAVIREVAYKP